jgi:quinol monooxygenase YgiN
MSPIYVTIWAFEVKQESMSAFEEIYDDNGLWARLFRRSPDFLKTRLIRDINRPSRYLTLDEWTSRDALLRFKHEYAAEYAALDRQCESLTESEALLGEFQQSAAPGSQ